MSLSVPLHATLDDWMTHEAIPFSLDSPETVDRAVDRVIAALDDSVELLGFGEALHGGEEILLLRNRLFQRLVTAHGYRALAIESSFPKAQVVNDYVAGRGPASYEEVQDAGFGHGLGRLEANRELIEWMRHYNADPSHRVKLRFHGFDIPSGSSGIASPGPVLRLVVTYLSNLDPIRGTEFRQRIESLVGADSDWDNPAIYADPTQSVGLSPSATALRIATEDLITELRTRQPELVAQAGALLHAEAVHLAAMARQVLNYHAAFAQKAGFAALLGLRDVVMADNLAYIVASERGRGKVLVFAHNAHLQRGKVTVWPSWQQALGSEEFSWWPAGAHLDPLFGSRYAVIGSAVGVSDANGIAPPEAGSLEARLTALPGTARFLPTHQGQGLPAEEIARVPVRSGSHRNLSYVPLTPSRLADFDWLAVLNATTYQRGGPPLPSRDTTATPS